MSGTRVTCTDVETGDSETVEIKNDYVVICDGDRYVHTTQVYPGPGTAIITIKRRATL